MRRTSSFLRRSTIVLAAFALGAFGCGADADLGREEVTSIGRGNASGEAFSGLYTVEVRTTDCQGRCAIDGEWYTASVCDIGEVESALVQITEKDGKLEASWEEPLSLLRGGVDANGAFEMGGFGTQQGGEIEISLRVVGKISDTALTGSARSLTVGAFGGGSVDCVGTYEVHAPRPSGPVMSLGPSCSSDSDCANGNCNNQTDTCQDPGAEGSPCSANDDCVDGNCNNQTDTCRVAGPEGAPCSANDDCVDGNCNNQTDTCRVAGPGGSPCSANDDCVSQSCNNDADTCN